MKNKLKKTIKELEKEDEERFIRELTKIYNNNGIKVTEEQVRKSIYNFKL